MGEQDLSELKQRTALLEQALSHEREQRTEAERRLNSFIEKQADHNAKTTARFAVLELKAGAWGAIASALVMLAALIAEKF